jgi:hypothetical protein
MADSGAERVRRHRERKKAEQAVAAEREAELRAMTEEQREQAIRDHWGYASSETRTEARSSADSAD